MQLVSFINKNVVKYLKNLKTVLYFVVDLIVKYKEQVRF